MERLDAQVAVVGAGPIGMTLAARLAQHGVSVILLEQHPSHEGEGSKALCMQRETLEIKVRMASSTGADDTKGSRRLPRARSGGRAQRLVY